MTKWFFLLVSNRVTFLSKFQVEKIMICSSEKTMDLHVLPSFETIIFASFDF
jgi:hypothetical protein